MEKNNHSRYRRSNQITYVPFAIYFSIAIVLIIVMFPNAFGINLQVTGDIKNILFLCLGGMFGSSARYSYVLINHFYSSFQRNIRSNLIWRFISAITFNLFWYLIIRGCILNSNIPTDVFNTYGILNLSVILGFFSYDIMRQFTSVIQKIVERENLVDEKIEKISSILGADVLDNYYGYFQYKIHKHEYNYQFSNNESNLIRYFLICHFQPEPVLNPTQGNTISQSTEIEIIGGKDSDYITFTVLPKISGIKITPSQREIDIQQNRKSQLLEFRFELPNDLVPDAWIEIYQKNRLISVITLQLKTNE